MKKIISVSIILAMLGAALVSCGVSKTPADTEADTAPVEVVEKDYSEYKPSEGLEDNGYFKGVTALDYVTLPDGIFDKKIEFPDEIYHSSEADIQSYMDSIVDGFDTYEQITDRAAENGDTVNIDYVGSIDGVEFEGGSTKGAGTEVTIGVTQYIDNFLDQIIGHNAGDNFDINVTFPDPYENNPDLAGKPAVFNCTLNYIVGEKIEAELTDEFVADKLSEQYGGAKTVEEFKAYVTKTLDDQINKASVETSYLQNYLAENSNVKSVPTSVFNYVVDSMFGSLSMQAQQYGMTLDDLISGYMGVSTHEEAVEKNRENLEKQAENYLIMQALRESNSKYDIDNEAFTAYFAEQFSAESDQITSIIDEYGAGYVHLIVMDMYVMDDLRGALDADSADSAE